MLKEYATLLKWGAGAVLAGFLFVGGCSYGTGKYKAQVAELEAQVSTLQDANKRFADIEDARKAELEKALAEARERKEAADKAAKALAEERNKREQAQKDKQAALEEARKDPDCARLLEMELCPIVPLP